MAWDTVLGYSPYGVSLVQLVIQTLVLIPPAVPTCTALPTCDLHTLFHNSASYRTHPRPYWLLTQDPLQPAPHEVTRWVITNKHVQVSHGWTMRDFRPVSSYTLTCVRGFDGATKRCGNEDPTDPGYIGRHQSKILFTLLDGSGDGRTRYVCMVITIRGPIVLQAKMSKVSIDESDVDTIESHLCSVDSLVDIGLTFVNYEDSSTGWNEYVEGMLQYVPCPINGGYTITSWADETGSTKCQVPKIGNLRVEDECEPGEGILFSEGLTRDCRNPLFGEVYKDDPLRCCFQWSDGRYDYAIALAEYPTAVYCIRVPTNWTTQTEVYFFKDSICDSTSDILHSKKYVKIGLVNHTIPSVCSDTSPWCTSYDVDTLSRSDIKPLCAATSGQCQSQEVFWHQIKVPDALRGTWYRETSVLPAEIIQMTDSHFKSTYQGTWRYAGEAHCNIQTHGLQEEGTFYFLISEPDNGCQPRVALLWLMTVSPSVLLFQLSHGEIIKNGDMSADSLCANYHFTFGETNQILKDRYYVEAFAWQNLVRTDGNPPLAKCHVSQWSQLQISYDYGTSCSLRLDQDGESGVTVSVQHCNRDLYGVPMDKPIHYDCLAQYQGKNNWTSFLITRNMQDEGRLGGSEYLCWVFEDPRGLLMPVSDCSDETMAEVLDMKSKTAVAQLSLTEAVTGRSVSVKSSVTLVGLCLSVLLVLLWQRYWTLSQRLLPLSSV